MSADEQASKSSPSASTPSTNGTNDDQNTDEVVVKKEGDTDDQYLRIHVINSDRTNEIVFRLKNDVAMKRMKIAYAKRLGHNADELRFVYEGVRIADGDTPTSLGMANEDVIEIYQEKTGGGM